MYDYGYDDRPWYDYKSYITSVEIENGITSVGNEAFYGYTGLTSITIPDSVKRIGDQAFQECTSLTSITIPDSVTNICYDAFYDCTGITDVYCYADPNNLEWGEGACDDFIRSETGKPTICHVREEYLDTYNTKFGAGSDYPVNVTFKAEKMDKCGDHAYWCFESDTGKLTISGTGEMSNYNGENQPWSAYKNNITSVEIKNGITSIGDDAFSLCTSLTSVAISDSVKRIGRKSFLGCEGLTSITIPDSVESIGEDAFYNCTNITDVYCYADPNNLEWDEGACDDFIRSETGKPTICHVPEEHIETYEENFGGKVNVKFKAEAMDKCGGHAYWCFESDTHKLTISGTGEMKDYYNGDQPWYNYKDNITSVKIENGITSIGNSAFDSCVYLTSITIPDSVKRIGDQEIGRAHV